MSETIMDGVHRSPKTGVEVIIVGAGVGGLMAALECWRKGCDVTVLERASDVSPQGDYFTIPPSGVTTLKQYPSMYADYHEVVYDCSISIWTPSGRCIKKTYPEWRREGAETSAPDVSISFLKRRPVFTKMLLDQCVRLGIPVHFSCSAKKVHESESGVEIVTADGEKYRGDVCVAADGIGTSFTAGLAGAEAPVLDSGYAVARAAFPRDMIKKGSPAEELVKGVEEEPEFRTYLGDNLHFILFLTKDWVAFAYTHESDGKAAESWHDLRDPSIFIEQLERKSDSWDPAVLDFLKQIPVKVVDWGLRWRDPVEQWTSEKGRIVKLGDAAHAFLPTAGNGAVQACEDAVSLAECLRLGGKDGAHYATKVHNKLRFERTSILQQAGFINREELHHADLDEIARQPEANDVGFFKHGRWVWSHNPEKYAREQYAACLAHLRDGRPFSNTNLPPGHVYQPWSMESENKRIAAGKPSCLKSNGYWGV